MKRIFCLLLVLIFLLASCKNEQTIEEFPSDMEFEGSDIIHPFEKEESKEAEKLNQFIFDSAYNNENKKNNSEYEVDLSKGIVEIDDRDNIVFTFENLKDFEDIEAYNQYVPSGYYYLDEDDNTITLYKSFINLLNNDIYAIKINMKGKSYSFSIKVKEDSVLLLNYQGIEE